MSAADALREIVSLLNEEHEADLDGYENLMQRVYNIAAAALAHEVTA